MKRLRRRLLRAVVQGAKVVAEIVDMPSRVVDELKRVTQ
jgi:hypothetical protein